MAECDDKKPYKKVLKKITKQRLKNIGLYYLQRFESSVDNLRQVLKKRVNDYARQNSDFDKHQAYAWIEELLADFESWKYLDDNRYAEMKITDYLNAGKPERYIKNKLKQKGIAEDTVTDILQNKEYNLKEMALKLARKKRIGPFRESEESRRTNRQKDMGTLIRAGFDYDVVCEVLDLNAEDCTDDEYGKGLF